MVRLIIYEAPKDSQRAAAGGLALLFTINALSENPFHEPAIHDQPHIEMQGNMTSTATSSPFVVYRY